MAEALTVHEEYMIRQRRKEDPGPGLFGGSVVDGLLATLDELRSPAGLYRSLQHEQHRRCAYLTREGDGRTCDCKYGLGSLTLAPRGEMTGCPELRCALAALRGIYPQLREA